MVWLWLKDMIPWQVEPITRTCITRALQCEPHLQPHTPLPQDRLKLRGVPFGGTSTTPGLKSIAGSKSGAPIPCFRASSARPSAQMPHEVLAVACTAQALSVDAETPSAQGHWAAVRRLEGSPFPRDAEKAIARVRSSRVKRGSDWEGGHQGSEQKQAHFATIGHMWLFHTKIKGNRHLQVAIFRCIM